MRATELSKMLSLNTESVAQMLLPNGKRKAAEWECGDLNGASGDSLKVRLTGSKAGVWSDFASGESGDLIGLWMAVRGLSLKEACEQAKDYLGVQDEAPLKAKPLYNRPNKTGITNLSDAHLEWLTVTRAIPVEVLKLYRIASKGDWIAFPSIRDKELIACKYRKMNKEFLQDAGCEPCLFGWQAVSPKSRKILICEGEMDALAWASYGIPALSVPMGAGTGAKHSWVENEFANLSNMDVIYLSMDMDAAGQASVAELVQRLGSERVRVVSLPEKDANACLMAKVPQGVIDKAMSDASSLDPQELRKASSFEEAVLAETYRRDEGLTLPWLKTHDLIRLRDGEVSVWGGINGHGKALCLDTLIPTPNGLRRFGDLSVGDKVFDEKGNQCNIVAETKIQHKRPCYKVRFSDGAEIVADANHEWLTHTALSRASARNSKARGKLKNNKLSRMQSNKKTLPSIVTTKEISESVYGNKGCRSHLLNHSIPVCGALNYQEKNLPIEPYVLGCWLGDGTSRNGQFTTNDKQIIDEIKGYGYKVSKQSAKYAYGILGLSEKLRLNGFIENKYVPTTYLRSSKKQRLELLQGLMDTDGCITGYGRCEFTNKNKNLALSVLDLVRSLGIQASLITGRATLYGKDCGVKYRVCFTPTIPVFRLERKADKLLKCNSIRAKHRFIASCDKTESVPVKCIQVDSPSHLFLVGETLIPTHNSNVIDNVVVDISITQGITVLAASLEYRAAKWLHRLSTIACGIDEPTDEFRRACFKRLSNNLMVFDVPQSAKAKRIMEVFRYASKRYGVKFFLIDNLTKCGFDDDDYSGQKNFVEELSDFARTENVHIAIVMHMRKGETGEEKPSGKFGFKGSGGITDMASTVIEVWRNKKKEKEAIKSQTTGQPSPEVDKPDTYLFVHKQRESGFEPTIALWFNQKTLQFLGAAHHKPTTVGGMIKMADGR
jgi:hypothetical protein